MISTRILDKDKCLKYKYKNIPIGRHVLAECFKNPKTYENKIFFIIKFSINIIKAGQIISTCKFYKSLDIKAVYLDHIFYLNGIFYAFFINQKIIIYTNNFPLSIIRVGLKNRKQEFQKVEGILKLPFEKKDYSKSKNLIKKKIYEMTKHPKKFLPWLRNTKYHKVLSNKFKQYDYVVYCHSFTDAQLIYGDDGFSSTYEWLIFTLNFLKHKGAKVIIKPHPNFWNSYLIKKDSLINFDRKIYKNILLKYNNVDHFLFLNNAISNFDLMKKLNKKCILISHHGSVIFEASAMNFKTIFSEATFYSNKYRVSNSWNSKKEYQKLLDKKWVNLKFSNTRDLHKLFGKYFYDDHSYYGKYYWQKVLSDHLKINFVEFTEKIESKFNKLVSKKEINKIINKSLKCITDVN